MSLARSLVVAAGILAQTPSAFAVRIVSQVPTDSSEVRSLRTTDGRVRFELCRLEKPIGCGPIGNQQGYAREDLERRFSVLQRRALQHKLMSAGVFIIGYVAVFSFGMKRGLKSFSDGQIEKMVRTGAEFSFGGAVVGGIAGIAYYELGNGDEIALESFGKAADLNRQQTSVITLKDSISEFVQSLNHALMLTD